MVREPVYMVTATEHQGELLDQETFAGICKALGHPARVKIVALLAEVDGCICGQIVDMLPLAQSTVSQHLKQLKQAELIVGEMEGPRICYCLNKQLLKRFRETAAKL